MAVADSTLTNNGDSGTEERGLDYLNVTGAASILRTSVQTSHDTNAHVLNTAAGTTNLTVDDSTFSASEGNTGFRVRGEGASTMVANVTDSTFSANFDVGFSMQTDAVNTAQQTLLFHNNDVSGGHSGAVSGRPQISINVGGSSNVKATVSNNDVKSALGHEIILNTSASSTPSATFDATVSGNDVGDAQPGALDPGADGGTGINGWLHGDGVARLAITDNTVQNWGGRAMELSHNDGIGTADYTVANNALSNPDARRTCSRASTRSPAEPPATRATSASTWTTTTSTASAATESRTWRSTASTAATSASPGSTRPWSRICRPSSAPRTR